jgi:cholesterol oxidase
MTDGGGKTPPLLKFLGEIAKHPVRFVKHLWPLGMASTTTVVLVMQTDENYLRLNYKPRWWRLGGGIV